MSISNTLLSSLAQRINWVAPNRPSWSARLWPSCIALHDGHKPSFTVHSEFLPRSAHEWQVSGDESEPQFGWTRPFAVGRGGRLSGSSISPGLPYTQLRQQRFPDEQTAIDHWFRASRDARKAAFTPMALHSLPNWLAAGLRLWRGKGAAEWAQHTMASELVRVSIPQLRAVPSTRSRASRCTAPTISSTALISNWSLIA